MIDMIPESLFEIVFFIIMLLLGYQAIIDITTTYNMKERIEDLERRIEDLEKRLLAKA